MPRFLKAQCPPGVLCVTPTLVMGFVLLIAAILMAVVWHIQPAQPVTAPPPSVMPQPIAINMIGAEGGGGDDRYTRAPKPERHWITQPDLPSGAEIYGKLPRVPTRGIPETYQSMGIITMGDGKILPLYGRRTASRSDRFQYYTRTDTYNPVQLPIKAKRRDCQDDVGCDELYNDDEVNIASMGKGKTTIYRFDGPTYVPGII